VEVSREFHALADLAPNEGVPLPIGYEFGWASQIRSVYIGQKQSRLSLSSIKTQFHGCPAHGLDTVHSKLTL